jgi:hypothetical protein
MDESSNGRRPRRPPTRRSRRRSIVGGLFFAAALAVPAVAGVGGDPVAAGQANGQEIPHELLPELAAIRAATATYHQVDDALADGYDLMAPLDICIQHQPDGAMGYHYFNQELMADPTVDPLHPEAMVYEPLPGGGRRLVAVEWIVPSEVWAQTGNTEPPELLGMPLHILNPVLGWYIIHAWVWKPNPSGMFADWNPRVPCR